MSAVPGPFRVEQVAYTEALDDLRAVRETVFVQEQRVPQELEWDELDPHCHHVLARDLQGQPIGTGRLTPERSIGRMAVLREWRNAGVGDALLHALLRQARALGLPAVTLHAQVSAERFYVRHGFAPFGERFMEAGIEHQEMRRLLDRPQAIESRDAAVVLTTELILRGGRLLCIRSRELDPGLLDAPRVLEALRAFATRGQGNDVRILLHDAGAAQRAHAPLLGLAQRLPSVFAIRETSEAVDRTYSSAFMTNDNGGYYFRKLGHIFDGEAELDAGGRARHLANGFNEVWERSRPCTELRALGI